VGVRGQFSRWVLVKSGVPQGSVLGPLLFLLYVNELPDWIVSSMVMFADDTKVWREITRAEDARELQEDLNRLRTWAGTWLMQFNAEKCKVMHINHTLDTEYFMEKSGAVCKLGEVHEERDLGIMVSRELKTSLQCAKAAAKASSVLGMIRRHFEDLDGDSFLILYKGFVRPHLEYCVQAWSPHLRKDIDLMEKVQRRATKMVRGLKQHSYQRRLKVLGLQTLEQRRIRGDMIEVFKILTGREAVDPATYFVMAERKAVTRGHKYKLFKPRCRSVLRSSFFSQRVIDGWNGLPEEVVEAPSICSFKKRYDNWIGGNERDI
jgi:hypothetical protein